MTRFTQADHCYMQQALELAEKGRYTTTPNPRVGCILVRDNEVVGYGYHQRAGEAHAEIHALNMAREKAQGATAYITLEPCSHSGLTPPCTDALKKAGIKHVIAAMKDPNPLVAGQGFAQLQAAGIKVQWGLLDKAAYALNIGFISRMERHRPWVRLKIAASLDGKTALASGESKWITSVAAREDVQRLRANACAILSGIGTVVADNPAFTVRSIDIGRQPLRVIVDSTLRIPIDAMLFNTLPVLMVTCQKNTDKIVALQAKGIEVAVFPGPSIVLEEVLSLLAERGCNEVLVEAGRTLNSALLQAKLIDEVVLYQAPIFLGCGARDITDIHLDTLADKIQPTHTEISQIGPDVRWQLRLHNWMY